jgi:hypothetical protein
MPERKCETCKHFRPWKGGGRLTETYAKCESPRTPRDSKGLRLAVFADTVRGMTTMCSPEGLWWERRPPVFEVVEDERRLPWEDEPDPEVDV